MKRIINLLNIKFGRLLVISRAKNSKSNHSRWLCKCDCGQSKIVYGISLKSGKTNSCGCFQKEIVKNLKTIHNRFNTREYTIWTGIKVRCNDINNKAYKYYGGRGIKVCERWLKSFQNFIDDVGLAPSNKHSIDRINNNGDYSPENCRWVTHQQQCNNTRRNIIINNISLTEYCRTHNLRYGTIHSRIRLGWSIEKAISIPIRSRKCAD